MKEKCSKYEALFTFSSEDDLRKHLEECEDCRAEEAKLENVLLENREWFQIGILLTVFAGLRIGELCAVQW